MKNARKRYLITQEQYEKLEKTARLETPLPSDRLPHPNVAMAREASTNAADILNSKSLSEFDKTLQHAQEYQRYLHHLKRALLVPKEEAYLGNVASSRQPHTSPPPPPPPPPPAPPTSEQPSPHLTQTPSRRRQRNRRTKRPPPTTPSTPIGSESLAVTTPRTIIARADTPVAHKPLTPPASVSSRAYSEERLIADMEPEDRPRAARIIEAIKGQPNMSWNPSNGTVRINGRMETDGNIKGLLVDILANKRQLSSKRQYDAVSRLMRRQ
jgi:hypothetical protein